MVLEKAKAHLKEHHDNLTANVQRWGGVSVDGGVTPRSNGCYMDMYLKNYYTHEYMYLVFHGDGTALSIPELTDFEKQNEAVGANPRGYNQFEGTQRSLKWVEYLLSDKSPWRSLHKFMVPQPAADINTSGWLFTDMKAIPNRLFYNFAMAQRFLWENSPAASHWFHLCDHGVDPTVALFVASNFMLSPEAKDITGPWSVYYPWSFLEGGNLDCARRFITGNPGTPDGSNTPNVLPLWQCKNHAPWLIKTNELCDRINLSLDEILAVVDEAVNTQEV